MMLYSLFVCPVIRQRVWWLMLMRHQLQLLTILVTVKVDLVKKNRTYGNEVCHNFFMKIIFQGFQLLMHLESLMARIQMVMEACSL